jgi:ParB-like chromosome segregation protein Spo0J
LAGDFVVGWEVAGQLTSLSPPERHLIVTDGEFIVDIDARQLRLGLDGPGLRPEDWAVQEQLDPETVGTVAQTELVPTYNAQAEALNVVLSLIDGETAMPSDEFIESIRTQGQLVPVLLRRSDDGRFVIVDGRRRVRALRRLGVPAVAARVLPMAARGAPEWAAAITANFQRSPNPIGEYEAVNSLIALGWDVARIAGDLRIPEYRVRERLALGNLTADARGLFTSRRMAVTTATRLARLTATQQAQAIDHFRQRAVGVPRLTMRDINAILPPRVDPRQRDLEDVDETGADSDGRMTQAEWREADAEWRAARRAEDASRATVVGLEDTEPGWPRVLVALRIAEENIPVAPDGRIERLFDQITEWIERVQRIVSRPDPDESSDAVERAIGAMVDDTARQAAAGRRQANPH